MQSLDVGNLKMLLKYYKNFESNEIEFYSIINNRQSNDDTNYLHFLAENLNQENFDQISEMIKLLIERGCNINLLNKAQESPLNVLKEKLKTHDLDPEIVHEFKTFQNNHIYEDGYANESFTNDNNYKNVEFKSERVNINAIILMIRSNDKERFLRLFEQFTQVKNAYTFDAHAFMMEQAILNQSLDIVRILLDSPIERNEFSYRSLFKLPPVFLACRVEFSEVLSLLLSDDEVQIFKKSGETILHEICASKSMSSELKTCFDLAINDERCTVDLINSVDLNGLSAILYSCKNRYDHFTLQLLRNGCYIGHKHVLDHMSYNMLKQYLDGCIQTKGNPNERQTEINISLKFLKAPEFWKSFSLESKPLYDIGQSENLEKLLLHPVLSTFSLVKWYRLNFMIYFNLLFWFGIMAFLTSFILMFFEPSSAKNLKEHSHFCRFAQLIVCILLVFELIQLIYSRGKYFSKLTNWLDLLLIFQLWVFFFDFYNMDPMYFIYYKVFLIMIMAAQCIQFLSKISVLSLSLHYAIFKKVCLTFLKSFAFYSILIVAFASSFFTLMSQKKNEENAFSGVMATTITTLRMMLAEFDAGKIKIGEDTFVDSILLLFIFFISIVLFNLLNALAVSDTQSLMLEAKLLDVKKRVSVIFSYEIVLKIFRIYFFDVFSSMIPNANVILLPNQIMEVKTRPSFENLHGCVVPINKTKNYNTLYQLKTVWRHKLSSQFKMALKLEKRDMNDIIEYNERSK